MLGTMKTLPLLALVAATHLGSLVAQAPPPVTHMVIAPQAWASLDSLARDARARYAENAACLTRYTVHDSTMTVEAFGPAVYLSADSVAIRASGPICNFGVPSVHTHIAFNGWPQASDQDRLTARYRGIWNLLLSVRENGWTLLLY